MPIIWNDRSTDHRTYTAEQSRENMHLAEIEALRAEVARLRAMIHESELDWFKRVYRRSHGHGLSG